MNITQELSNILQKHSGSAFLFIGSGFSRRYLGLEDWEGLLTKFSINQPFNYYKGLANKDLAKAASLLAKDFYESWWKDEKYKISRETYQNYDMNNPTTPLRIEISNYLRNINLVNSYYQNEENLLKEIELLRSLNLDGIITTNWDLFLENLFPDYKVFIGQNELLFSNVFEIGEIYKIHGCVSNPNSLVLTDEDYINFEQRNAYLAAKLITIFMEHPIIFIGYSLNDKNIRDILQSIVQCLDEANLYKLQNNLIFVQRLSGNETEQIAHHTMNFSDNNISLPTTLIKTNNFEHIYQAIQQTKKKLPVKLLRHFKEQFYELAHSSSTQEKICVIDAEHIDNYEDIEFVIGLGIEQKINELGYSRIEPIDIFKDVLFNNANYDPEKILLKVITSLRHNIKYIPLFKYLNLLGITSHDEYKSFSTRNNIDIDRFAKLKIKDLQSTNKYYRRKFSNMTVFNNKLADVINTQSLTVTEKIFAIPFLPVPELENQLPLLRDFLINNIEQLETSNNSDFKKLIVLYDLLKHKWK